MAERVGFEPTQHANALPVFKTGLLNHLSTAPYSEKYANTFTFLCQSPRKVRKKRIFLFTFVYFYKKI